MIEETVERNTNKRFSPRMEWYFDEISEVHSFICPVTGKKVTAEFIRRAGTDETPFVDVVYCSIFRGAPTCKKKCLSLINHMRHFKKQ
ncbi:MAG TPA: hypothetical protein VNK81_01115 [Thermodesulfobacteriota bacterium]|nr:hypothetical protein [Thermodesulfobacteriota bacterium]